MDYFDREYSEDESVFMWRRIKMFNVSKGVKWEVSEFMEEYSLSDSVSDGITYHKSKYAKSPLPIDCEPGVDISPGLVLVDVKSWLDGGIIKLQGYVYNTIVKYNVPYSDALVAMMHPSEVVYGMGPTTELDQLFADWDEMQMLFGSTPPPPGWTEPLETPYKFSDEWKSHAVPVVVTASRWDAGCPTPPPPLSKPNILVGGNGQQCAPKAVYYVEQDGEWGPEPNRWPVIPVAYVPDETGCIAWNAADGGRLCRVEYGKSYRDREVVLDTGKPIDPFRFYLSPSLACCQAHLAQTLRFRPGIANRCPDEEFREEIVTRFLTGVVGVWEGDNVLCLPGGYWSISEYPPEHEEVISRIQKGVEFALRNTASVKFKTITAFGPAAPIGDVPITVAPVDLRGAYSTDADERGIENHVRCGNRSETGFMSHFQDPVPEHVGIMAANLIVSETFPGALCIRRIVVKDTVCPPPLVTSRCAMQGEVISRSGTLTTYYGERITSMHLIAALYRARMRFKGRLVGGVDPEAYLGYKYKRGHARPTMHFSRFARVQEPVGRVKQGIIDPKEEERAKKRACVTGSGVAASGVYEWGEDGVVLVGPAFPPRASVAKIDGVSPQFMDSLRDIMREINPHPYVWATYGADWPAVQNRVQRELGNRSGNPWSKRGLQILAWYGD